MDEISHFGEVGEQGNVTCDEDIAIIEVQNFEEQLHQMESRTSIVQQQILEDEAHIKSKSSLIREIALKQTFINEDVLSIENTRISELLETNKIKKERLQLQKSNDNLNNLIYKLRKKLLDLKSASFHSQHVRDAELSKFMPIMNEMKEWKEKRTVKNRIQSSEKKFNFIKAILEKKSADIESATLSTEAFTGTPPISSKSDISSQLKILQTQLKEKLQEEKQFSSVLVQEELATASLCENQVKCLLKMIDSLKIEIPKIVADELEEKKQAIYSNSDNARMDDEITLTTSSGKTKKVENEDGTINEMKSIPVEQEQIEDSVADEEFIPSNKALINKLIISPEAMASLLSSVLPVLHKSIAGLSAQRDIASRRMWEAQRKMLFLERTRDRLKSEVEEIKIKIKERQAFFDSLVNR